MAKWFYVVDGRQKGPLKAAELRLLALSGGLKPTDRIRREDMTDWHLASEVKGLFPVPEAKVASAHVPTTATVPSASSKHAEGSPGPIVAPKKQLDTHPRQHRESSRHHAKTDEQERPDSKRTAAIDRGANDGAPLPASSAELQDAQAVTDGSDTIVKVWTTAAQFARKGWNARRISKNSRVAIRTGTRIWTLVLIPALLLVSCMILPLALGWTVYFSSQGVENKRDIGTGSSHHLPGAMNEDVQTYTGYTYSALFQPLKLRDSESKFYAATMTALAGPLLITGSAINMQGSSTDAPDNQQGQTQDGSPSDLSSTVPPPRATESDPDPRWNRITSDTGSATVRLGQDSKVGAAFVLGLMLVLLITELIVGDRYFMQKLLIAIGCTWFVYSLTFGFVVQALIRHAMRKIPDSSQANLSLSGLTTAPMKIAIVLGLYWAGSMLLRRRAENRQLTVLATANQQNESAAAT